MRRRTSVEITIETSLLVVRRGAHRTSTWCAQCASPVPSVTPEESAVPAGDNQRAIFRWLECGLRSLGESAASSRQICLDSLHRSVDIEGHEGASTRVADRDNQPPNS